MSDNPNHITRAELAALIGARSPSYINELEKSGRALRAPDGKNWLKAESLAAYRAGRDPSKQGVVDRWAASRAASAPQGASVTDAATDTPDEAYERPSAPQRPAVDAVGSTYQQARAVKEKFFALEAKRAYEVNIGSLRDAKEVEGIVATAMTEIRLRLQNLAVSLAPVIAAQSDEATVRASLADAFEHTLRSASHHFSQLSTPTSHTNP